MTPRARKLLLLFVLATALGAGPGLLLVPLLPELVLGMPRLYVWLVGWFGVEVLLVTAAMLADPPAKEPS